jgi:hypothetical protein
MKGGKKGCKMAASSSSQEEDKYQLGPEGYLVVDDILSPEECRQICYAIYWRLIQTTFIRRGFRVDPADLGNLKLFVDQKARARRFGEGKPSQESLFRGGNSRTPLVSKSTGMSDHHYIPEVLEGVAFNPKLYQVAQDLYGEQNLAFTAGLEKTCFKVPGTTAMGKHIDHCPFLDTVNYPRRYQALVTASIDTSPDLDPLKTGTLVLLTNFHHYSAFFGRLCHPKTGLFPFPDTPASYSRFFVLPSNFDSFYRTKLIKYAKKYRRYLDEDPTLEMDIDTLEAFQTWKTEGVCLEAGGGENAAPRLITLPSPLPKLKWKAIRLRPGQAVFWDQRLPHYSAANASSKVRVACYYSIFPTRDAPLEAWSWLHRQLGRFQFFYGKEADRFPTQVKNPEEVTYLADHPEEKARVARLIRTKGRKVLGML